MATLVLGWLLAPRAGAEELVVDSFGSGMLTFNQLTNGIAYRVEWATSPGGAWTNFAAASAHLDAIVPTNAGPVSVPVPMFYRVVAVTASMDGDLVINEVDYDQPVTDTEEFVEIHNNEAFPVALSAFRLEFVNGGLTAPGVYLTVQLSAAGKHIPAHGFLVVGNTSVVNRVEGALTIAIPDSVIQNGAPDGIRLVKQDGTFVDGLAYEGSMPGVGEGNPSAGESASPNSLQRYVEGPDGDTSDNASDFVPSPPTPGVANVVQ